MSKLGWLCLLLGLCGCSSNPEEDSSQPQAPVVVVEAPIEKGHEPPSSPSVPRSAEPTRQSARGQIRVDAGLDRGLILFVAAAPADVTNGRLRDLLTKHRAACTEDDPSALFSLFNQGTRYMFAKREQGQLAEFFEGACSAPFLGDLEDRFARGELSIGPDGHTELGVPRTVLCSTEQVRGSDCTRGLEVAIEDGALKWAWH